ncbi:MAG TPA: PAS domain S-box protein, partial [Gallionella sp.]|nr:PAS domain S-box protein [Gallionella sp.]
EKAHWLLRNVLQGIPDPVWMKDADGAFVFCNPGVARLFNMKEEEIIGKTDFDFFDAEMAEFYRDKDRASLEAGGVCINEEWWTFGDNGEQALMETRKVPVRSPDGKLLGVLGVARDITERKRMETEALEARNTLNNIIDGIADPIFVKDRQHRWMMLNEAFCAFIGHPREAMIGKSDYDFFPQEQADVFWEMDEAVFVSGEANLNEESFTTASGELRYIHTKKTPFVSGDGRQMLVGVIRDITERKRDELILRASEAMAQSRSNLLHAIIESSPDIIVFALDTDYRYLSFNRKHRETMLAIWGKEIDVGMNMLEVIGTHADREAARCAMDRALAGESFVLEDAYGDESLSRQYWQNHWSPIRSGTGEVTGLTCFVLNVTERKRIEEALRANEEKLGNLFALSPLGIALTDMQGRYVEFNEAFRAICGYPADELMTLDYWTLTPREYEADEVKQLESLTTTGRYGPYEKEYRQKDGTLIPIQLNGMLVTGKDGQQYIWSIVEDITGRKRTEDTLRFIAEGEWLRSGEAFLNALARYLGKLLGVDYVVIDKRDADSAYVETVALYAKGEIVPNMRYALEGTPCGEVMSGVLGCYPEDIRGLFPAAGVLADMQAESYVGLPLWDADGKVFGLIAALDSKPMADAHAVKLMLKMVASSVAAELKRNQMEQVLRESYESLSEAQRISHVGNWELDLTNGALVWSDEIYRIFEIDPAQFDASYDAFLNAIHPDDREAVSLAYTESLERRVPYEIEHRLLFADGRIKHVHERCETHYDLDGKPVRSLGTVQDITARKQAEEALRDSLDKISHLNRHLEENALRLEENARHLEEQTVELEASQEQLKQTEAWYRSILHSAPDGMLVVDERGVIIQVNARLKAMFGYERGELTGQPLEVLLPQAFRKNHVGQRSEYFASGADRRPAMLGKTLYGCRKDGSVFPVDVSLSRLPEIYGMRNSICASVRDITERQAMEAARENALAEAQRLAQLRSAFMAQMSHELRTPLNGILGYTQNLLHGGALAEKQVAGLNIIQHSGEHLLSLINGLLDHAAIEADKFELIAGDIELDPFLRAIIGIVRIRAEQKNISFSCDAGADLPAVVRGDAQRLRQVLLNLLANAVKFTDKGAVVLRVSHIAPSRIRFAVQDSGVGISADQLEKIFLPFEQIGETQRRAGGTGLGLAISRKLVTLMGGDIKVESQPGSGSVFSFEIEMAAVQSDSAKFDAAALSEHAATNVAQATALIVVPPREALDTLHGLALRGSMRDVMRYAEPLAEEDAHYQPFVEQLRQLAKTFQTKALLALIEQYRNEQEAGR